MNPQRHDCFYGEAAELGGLKSELANLSALNEGKYFHLSVNQCEIAVKSFPCMAQIKSKRVLPF